MFFCKNFNPNTILNHPSVVLYNDYRPPSKYQVQRKWYVHFSLYWTLPVSSIIITLIGVLASFLTSKSPNWAVIIFVHTSFNVAKQSVLGGLLPGFAGMGKKRARFVKCIHVTIFVIFPTSFSNSNSLSQPASSCTGKCYSMREAKL